MLGVRSGCDFPSALPEKDKPALPKMDGLTEEQMASMVALMKSLKADDDVEPSDSSSDAGVLSDASADDDGEDDYRITALPHAHRTWIVSLTPTATDRLWSVCSI